jgi:hypothetical protein
MLVTASEIAPIFAYVGGLLRVSAGVAADTGHDLSSNNCLVMRQGIGSQTRAERWRWAS